VTSSLVIAAGFAAIIPSSFLPARHFAVLAAAAMLTALAADLVVLPPLLAWSRYRART
jgi:predicted RND superfamily exporter protein